MDHGEEKDVAFLVGWCLYLCPSVAEFSYAVHKYSAIVGDFFI